MTQLSKLSAAVLNGDLDGATEATQAVLDEGVSAEVIVKEGLVPGMAEVGRLFKADEYFVPDVLVSARAMKGSMAMVKPLLSEGDDSDTGTVVIGTVKGDMHDIGKNLVAMMLEGAGCRVIDLGVDVSPDKFIDAVKEHRPQMVALSALVTTTMAAMRTAIKALEEAGVRDSVKIIVGGAPVTQNFADEIGADGYAPEAGSAVEVASSLIDI